jgi:hypothetical protein
MNCPGVEFIAPVHPGNAPVHAANATGNQIIEVNGQYKQDLQAIVFNITKLHTQRSRAKHICETISWFPKKISMPIVSSNDLILAGIQDIVDAL